MRKALLFIVALFTMTLSYEVSAQQRVITGTVISDEDGLGLPGATVLVKGTTVGTTTNLDGNYSITVPAGSDVLVFSFVGLKSAEESIGNRTVIDVTLAVDAAQLSEVVVTAIGVEREKKALGYGVSTVGDEQLENRPEQDVSRVLQGKVPGVNITATNGMSGSGTNMVIRGYSTVTGSNQPLFVVDGVPFNTSTNSTNEYNTGGATTSSRFLDIDPNNIESMSVLKGLSATVLYGDQGRNGVILITTKSGSSKRKAAEVTINQSFFSNKAASLPTYGTEYGNGFQQGTGFFFSNFGARLDQGIVLPHPYATSDVASIRSSFPQFWVDGIVGGTPADYEYKAYEDPSTAFFRTGLVSNSSIQISGGSDRTGYSASFGYTDDKGFTPGNELIKYNFGLGVNSAVTDKLSINSSFTFAITDLETPPVNAARGSGPDAGIPSVFGHVLFTPRSIDLAGLPWENPVDKSSVYYRSANNIVNPIWLVNNYSNTSDVRRFFNATSLVYDVNDDFSITYRIGLDTYSEVQEAKYNKGGGSGHAAVQSGYYRTVNIENTIWNQDLVFNWQKEFSKKFGFSAILGGNSRYDTYTQSGIASQGQLAFDLFRHNNFKSAAATDVLGNKSLNRTEEQRRLGVYGTVTLDYSNYLFLNLSARNDWTSTVEMENRRILYPGVSLSFIPATAFNWNSTTFNDLKLRVAYGTSAGFPSPYRTRNTLDQNAIAFSRGGSLTQTHSVSNSLGNVNLKPELIEELEFGVEAAMFNNKLNLDISLFEKNTNDLITDSPIDPATGFTKTLINIGNIRTRGVEFQAIVNPISTAAGFNWNSIVNFSLYRSVTTELGDLDEVLIAGATDLGNFAIEGEPFNVIKGIGFARDPDGNPIVLSDGVYQADPNLKIIGDPNPKFTTSWINTISYKGFTLSAMLEYRHKGDIYSTTVTSTLARGVTKDPVVDRELSFIMPGVRQDGTNEDGTPRYIKNDIQISASDYFFSGYQGRTREPNVFDGSTIRLREVSLGYEISNKVMAKTPFKKASVALSASNLWFKALNFPPNMNFDTDVLGTGVGNGLGFDFVTGPSSRRVGGTITLVF